MFCLYVFSPAFSSFDDITVFVDFSSVKLIENNFLDPEDDLTPCTLEKRSTGSESELTGRCVTDSTQNQTN